MSIQSFGDKATERLFHGGKRVAKFSSIEKKALVALDKLNAAHTLQDLRSPPSNHLEKLKGDRVGQYSIRVNDQYRVCFRWGSKGPEDVEVCDYH